MPSLDGLDVLRFIYDYAERKKEMSWSRQDSAVYRARFAHDYGICGGIEENCYFCKQEVDLKQETCDGCGKKYSVGDKEDENNLHFCGSECENKFKAELSRRIGPIAGISDD